MPISKPVNNILAENIVPPAFVIGPALGPLNDSQDIDKFGFVPYAVVKNVGTGAHPKLHGSRIRQCRQPLACYQTAEAGGTREDRVVSTGKVPADHGPNAVGAHYQARPFRRSV